VVERESERRCGSQYRQKAEQPLEPALKDSDTLGGKKIMHDMVRSFLCLSVSITVSWFHMAAKMILDFSNLIYLI
jgi:hypothetical protein